MNRWVMAVMSLWILTVVCSGCAQGPAAKNPRGEPVQLTALREPDAGAPESRPIYAPYPGGSPFPPGGEPDLTHVAKVFWTTRGGLVTQIHVVADGGSRPTQTEWFIVVNGKPRSFGAGIAPGCDYHFAVGAGEQKPEAGIRPIKQDGEGMFVVKVHGFKAADFTNPPKVTVKYLKGGVLLGETSVTAQPVPERLKNATG